MAWITLNYDCDNCGGELKAFDVFGTGEIVDDEEVICADCQRHGNIECDENGGYRVTGISDEERE
jgi:RecJ-like exonuclease